MKQVSKGKMQRSSSLRKARNSIFDGRYEIMSTVGRGRNSVVYRAKIIPQSTGHDSGDSEQIVALKVLTGNAKAPEENHKRMRREALAMLSTRNQNVVRLFDYVAGEDLCYLAMEYADMGDLHAILEESRFPMHPEVVLQLMRQLLTGLEAVHRAGIYHRDIKPENLLLTSPGILKIADFGIALLPTEKEPFEPKNKGIGTFDYLAPEYLEAGISNSATDLYSVGVTAYQLLTKHLPFEGSSMAEQLKHKMLGDKRPLSDFIEDVPEHLDSLLDKAMATNYEDRFQTASQFKEAIEALLRGEWKPTPIEKRPRRETTQLRQLIAPESESLRTDESIEREREIYEYQDGMLVAKRTPQIDAREANLRKATSDLPSSSESFRAKRPAKDHRPAEQLESLYDKLYTENEHEEVAATFSQSVKPGKLKQFLAISTVLLIVAVVSWYFQDTDANLPELPSIVDTPAPVLRSEPLKITQVYSGKFSDLLAASNVVPFTISVVKIGNAEKTYLSLGLEGISPIEINLEQLNSGRELYIASNGLRLTLWKTSDQNGDHLSGNYRDQDSGRTGTWHLTPLSS